MLAKWIPRHRGTVARVPGVLQMEAVECGAASLAMVLAYHGRVLPLEQLRLDCNVTRDGTSAANLARAARQHGLKAKGFRKEPEQLASLPMPAILHWNFNHFLVLEGIRGERVYLNDPAFGRRVVDRQELEQSFTGVVLVLEPGPDFIAAHETPTLISRVWQRLERSKPDLLFILLVTLGLVLPGLVLPAFTKIFIDQYLVNRLADWVPMLLLAMLGMLVLTAVLTWLQQRQLLRLETRLTLSTSAAFLWHILQLPVEFFAQRVPGEVGSRVTINDRVASLLTGELASMALSLLTVGFFFALMLSYDWVLALISLGIAGLNFVLLLWFNARRRDASRRLQQESGKLLGTTMSGLQTIEPLKAAGGEADYFARWVGYFGKTVNAEQRLGVSDRILGVAPGLLGAINVTVVLGVGSVRVMDGALSMGAVIAFYYLLGNFLAPIGRFVQLGALLQTAEADLSRIDDVLRYQREQGLNLAQPDAAPVAERLSGALEIRGLNFGYYQLGPPLLQEIELQLAPGARLALVGGSGSGKSTLARLVCGLHRPWSGELLFDGRERGQWSRALLSQSVAFVDQELLVFADSIRNNLSLWDPTLSDAQLTRAGRDACIHDEIMARPGGYDAPVSEGGTNFSGGQLQRLELARALAHDPALVVLDEATSALDTQTEMQVMENLRRRGCACLVVSHRLSAIRDCDEILVLRQGRIVERGDHASLLAAGGYYVELLSAA